MKLLAITLIGSELLAFSTPATAAVNIDYVAVGNAGNAADITGYGDVAHDYRISKYEVTIGQYTEFLAAKAITDSHELYNSGMEAAGITRNGTSGSYTYNVSSGYANRPVGYVSWFDAARFVNWLSNGQGNGDTETGSYTLDGATSGIVIVNSGATIFLPSENEWYKAAYYDPTLNGGSGGYWLYPTQSNTISTADANYGMAVGATTDVGTYGPSSFYGTFDQAGNVREWNDAVISEANRGLRGSSWNSSAAGSLSSNRLYDAPANGWSNLGFRVVSIPEPSALVFTILFSGLMLTRRKR